MLGFISVPGTRIRSSGLTYSRSPDLNPGEFYWPGMLKDKIHKNNTRNEGDVKNRIQGAVSPASSAIYVTVNVTRVSEPKETISSTAFTHGCVKNLTLTAM
jgi:hypothetical protein